MKQLKIGYPLSISNLFSCGFFVLTVLGMIYAVREPALFLLKEWNTDEYSHSFLLPFLALFLSLHRLSNNPTTPTASWWGVVWVGISFALLEIGLLSTFRQISYLAIPLLLVGIIVTYWGTHFFFKIFPAFALIFFTIPIPFMLYNTLSLYLKLISTSVGVLILNLVGIPVFQDGNVIDLGTYKLQVVDACNGLRYLFPALAFAYLVAYLMKDAFWKRLFIFFSAIPLSIGLNAIRIAIVGITVNIWGTQAAEGFVHSFEGFVIFFACATLLLGEATLLGKINSSGSIAWDLLSIPVLPKNARPVLMSCASLSTFLLTVLFVCLTALNVFSAPHATLDAKAKFDLIPLSLKEWDGSLRTIDKDTLQALDLSDYTNIDYIQRSDPSSPSVNLYIAYYASQKIGSSIHSPATCLPGGGWNVQTTKRINVHLKPNFSIAANRLLAKHGDSLMLVYYWFDERGRTITGQWEAKWNLFTDALLTGRTDGSLIRLTTPVLSTESEEDADKRLRGFLDDVYLSIVNALPQKSK